MFAPSLATAWFCVSALEEVADWLAASAALDVAELP
jgi:hypothetical protein